MVCDCPGSSSSCWACFLVSTFEVVFGVDSDDSDDMIIEPSESEDSVMSDDSCNEADLVLAESSRRMARHADLSASGRQGSRKRVGQLIPDGLEPDEHVAASLALEHPFMTEEL